MSGFWRETSRNQHLIGVEMCKSKSVHMFANVVADATASEAWDGGSVRDGDRLEPSPLTTTRESACPPCCRVCFLARKYGLTPREVTPIALISSGKNGRAISQTLGIGMPTIRKYCGIAGSVLKFGKGLPSPGQECTGESIAATIPRQELRAIATLADKLPYRKLAREALALQGRLVEKWIT
jgi:hypothetical protein